MELYSILTFFTIVKNVNKIDASINDGINDGISSCSDALFFSLALYILSILVPEIFLRDGGLTRQFQKFFFADYWDAEPPGFIQF